VRAVPILVLILWVYYGLPALSGITLNVFWAIGLQELTRKANELVVSEYRPLEIYTILVLEYLVLILIVSAGVRWFERRMNASDT